MARPKVHRDIALYTRVSKKSDRFLKTVCKKSGMSRTAWLDSHLKFLQDNVNLKKMIYLEKTRDQI